MPLKVYSTLLNNQNLNMRIFLRKILYLYIVIFALLESISLKLKNPFAFTKKDFYAMIKYILNFFDGEKFSNGEKYKEFINIENNNGINYISFIESLNNIFIESRIIDTYDLYLINKLIKINLNCSKSFIDPQFFLDFGNIKIPAKENTYELNFDDVYFSFNNFLSEDYEKLLINESESELGEKIGMYKNNIFLNLVKIFEGYGLDKNEKNEDGNFDMNKIYQSLLGLQEKVPENVRYFLDENNAEIESNNDINQALFKKNKFGIYYNSFDEILFYEIVLLNKKLYKFHHNLNIVVDMIQGKINLTNTYYPIFKKLNEGRIPKILNIYDDINYLNQNFTFQSFNNIITNNISFYKQWIKDGFLPYYPLPVIHNHELFFYCVKLSFTKKFYGENDYSKITPDMISLKFFATKYKTYKELINDEEFLNKMNYLYNNEVVWVDGFVMNNAKIDENNKIIIFNNIEKNIKEKMNIIGITYFANKYKDGNLEIYNNSKNYNNNNDEEEEEYEEEEKEINYKTEDINDKIESGEIYEEERNKDKNKVKVYIYGNKSPCEFNKFYVQDSVGFIEFFCGNGYKEDINQNYIFEKTIKITIEDIHDFNK